MGTLDIGAATRAQQADECKVGNCGRVWHVGFSLTAWDVISFRMRRITV